MRSPTPSLTTSALTPYIPLLAIPHPANMPSSYSPQDFVLVIPSAWNNHSTGLYTAPSLSSNMTLDATTYLERRPQFTLLKNSLSTHSHTVLFCFHDLKSPCFLVMRLLPVFLNQTLSSWRAGSLSDCLPYPHIEGGQRQCATWWTQGQNQFSSGRGQESGTRSLDQSCCGLRKWNC